VQGLATRAQAVAGAGLGPGDDNFLYVIGFLLLAMGRPKGAVVSVGLGLLNSLIGSIQEVRAKRKLDEHGLLRAAS
jgi:cation-transporting ATPase E